MFEKVVNCPVCNSINFQNHIICKDHMITQESFSIVKCNNCQFLFTNPRPDTEHIGNYYKSDQYISHTDKSNNLINSVYKLARIYTLNKKVKLINSLVNRIFILAPISYNNRRLIRANPKGMNISKGHTTISRPVREVVLRVKLVNHQPHVTTQRTPV